MRDDARALFLFGVDAADFERRRSLRVEGLQKCFTTFAAIDLMQRGSRFERGSGGLKTSTRALTRSSRSQDRGRKFLLSKHLVFSWFDSSLSFYP